MLSIVKSSPVTFVLMAINALLFAGQFATQDGLTSLGLLYGPAVADGQYWRILSSGFLHSSNIHLLMNMFLLYVLGAEIEKGLGSLKFSMVYFGALFGGALAVLLLDFPQPTLGASGAVLGLGGAMFIIFWNRGVSPHKSPGFVLIVANLALPLLLPGISFWGHFGGVVAGAAMGFVLVSLPEKSRSTTPGNSFSMGAALITLLIAGCFVVPQLA